MRADLLLLAADLTRRGEAFALATVVGRGPPSSSRVGDAALITRGGTFHGWLGGACTQPTVVRAALEALADGAPRLITLTPEPSAERRDGVVALPMTCHSGGSVDVYIEPVLPPPRLVVLGVSPVAQALARLAKAAGFAVDAVDPDADRAAFPEADAVFTDPAPELRRPGARGAHVCAVVATMGVRDEDALRTALDWEPAYVGVVASRRRFAQLRETLLAHGVAAESLDRVKSPAGLDIGADRPEEIALSILAEIIQRRHAATPGAGTADAPAPGDRPAPTVAETSGEWVAERQAQRPAPEEETDPVCGMSVRVSTARHTAEHAGRTYYFCGPGCRAGFLADPARYGASAGAGGVA